MRSDYQIGMLRGELPTEPTFFLDYVIGRWLVAWLGIPFLFMAIKLLRAEFVDIESSDQLVERLTVFWPLLSQQHEAIKNLGHLRDATNFSLFHLSMFLYVVFLAGLLAYKYLELRSSIWITRPGSRELVIIGCSLAASVGGLIFDTPKLNPRPVWDFYIDPFGLYYLRQSIFLIGLGNAFLMALISVVRLVDVFPGARHGTDAM